VTTCGIEVAVACGAQAEIVSTKALTRINKLSTCLLGIAPDYTIATLK